MIHVYLRTLLMYLLLVAGIRLLGKRQVGQMEPSEFVVTMLTANLATMAIEDPDAAPVTGILAILTILGAELTISWITLGSLRARRLLCGRPVILIENGRLLPGQLRKTRISLDELNAMLRAKEVLDYTKVQYAILETNGSLSVFLHPLERPATAGEAGIMPEYESLPVVLVEDGTLIEENLGRAGVDRQWVAQVLEKRKLSLRDTLLLTLDGRGRIRHVRREEGE